MKQPVNTAGRTKPTALSQASQIIQDVCPQAGPTAGPKLLNLERCRRLMREQELDFLAPSTEEHIYYAAEFPIFQYTFEPETVAFVLLPADPSIEPWLIIPHFTRLSLLQFPTWMPNVGLFGKSYYVSGAPEIGGWREETVYGAFARAVSETGIPHPRIGIEKDRLSVEALEKLKEAVPHAEFVDGRGALLGTREVKTEEEIRRLRKAAHAIEEALAAAFEIAEPGKTERDLERAIHRRLLDEGCTTGYVQAGTGTRGAFGPVYPSDTPIWKGDLIRIDASACFEHYLSDICRMAVVGEPTSEMRDLYATVFDAEMAALKLAKPGVRACDLFEEAVRHARRNGAEDFSRNNVGHGIGVISHERPHLTPDNHQLLEPGMVICVETPYYRWGTGGFAPEDEILITDLGCELLTHPQEELIRI